MAKFSHSKMFGAPLGVGLLAFFTLSTAAGLTTSTKTITQVAGVDAGLCVYIGCGNIPLLTELHNGQRMLVHGITRDPSRAELAREAILEAGLYGLVSVEVVPDWSSLPYVDAVVNLVVADDLEALRQNGLAMAELTRILAPGAKIVTTPDASIGPAKHLVNTGIQRVDQSAGLLVATKALAAGADDWTHWNHGCEGNALSNDIGIAPPTHLKWTSGNEQIEPKSGDHPGIRVIGDRMVFAHKISSSAYSISCRDAQSGVTVWENSKDMTGSMGGGLPQFVIDQDRVYFSGTHTGPVRVLKMSDGKLERTLTEINWSNNERRVCPGMLVCDGKLVVTMDSKIWVYDAAQGTKIWTTDGGGTKYYFPAASTALQTLYVIESSGFALGTRWPYVISPNAIVAFDLKSGTVKWRNAVCKGRVIGQLMLNGGSLGFFGSRAIGGSDAGEPSAIGVIDAVSGKTRWVNNYSKLVSSKTGDTKTLGYSAAMNGDFFWISQGEKLIRFGVKDGAWKKWATKSDDPSSKNQRCAKGILLAKYAYTGYGTWLGYDNTTAFKPIRRGGCGEPPYPAQGNMYFSPATCGCIPELDGGNGYLALSTSGNRSVASGWVFTPSTQNPENTFNSTYNWYLSGSSGPVSTSVLRKAVSSVLSGIVPSGWPENQTGLGFAKRAAATRTRAGGYEFVNQESRLVIEIRRDGATLGFVVTGGRVSAAPVTVGTIAVIGARDGFVYGVELSSGKATWRFRAAPRDERVVASNQLESTWPVTDVTVSDGAVVVRAGRHGALSGGYFIHGLNPSTGERLWTKREFFPESGALAEPEKGFYLFESVPTTPGGIHEQDAPLVVRSGVKPVIDMQQGAVRISFGPGGPVRASLKILDMRGRLIVGQSGVMGEELKFPLAKFRRSRYVLTIESGGAKTTMTFAGMSR